MKLLADNLANDIGKLASNAFMVAAIELDEGTLFLSDREVLLGTDLVLAGVGTFSDNGFNVEQAALPEEYAHSFWLNREVAIFECVAEMGSVYDGAMQFDGIVESEPVVSDGLLSVNLTLPRVRIVNVPDYGTVDIERFPFASETASGQYLPLVIGEVENCPLLTVATTQSTTLSAAALPGNNSLAVDDATVLPEYGAVWVGDESIFYSSHDDTTLFGCNVKAAHAAGSAVVFAGEYIYQAAGNACLNITQVKGNEAKLKPIANTDTQVIFAKAPIVPQASERMNALLQFDSVATAAFTQEFKVSYPSYGAVTVKPNDPVIANTTTLKTGSVASVTPAPNKQQKLSIKPNYRATGAVQVANFVEQIERYGIPQGGFFPTYYTEFKNWARVVFTFQCNQTLDIPAGANARIALVKNASLSQKEQGITRVASYAINGSPVTDSTQLTVSGAVVFTSTVNVVSICLSDAGGTLHPALRAALIKANSNKPLTLDSLFADVKGDGSRRESQLIQHNFSACSKLNAGWLQA